jgi:hypothetical protein
MNRFLIAALAAGVVACSGADGNGLLDDSGTQPGDDASTNDKDTSTGEDASTVPDATTEDVVVTKDVNVIDVAPDVPIGPADSKIQCGPSTTCSAQNELCCWHQSSTTKQYECVTSTSSCSGTYDVPVTCSTTDNCASQGHAGYQCCSTGGNWGWGTCSNYDVSSIITCKSQCALTDYELGCSVQKQNCSDSQQTCIVSKCTAPGDTMCY